MHSAISAPNIQHCYSLSLSNLLSQYPVPQCPLTPSVQYKTMYLVDLSIVRISCCICDASSVMISFCSCISLKVTFLKSLTWLFIATVSFHCSCDGSRLVRLFKSAETERAFVSQHLVLSSNVVSCYMSYHVLFVLL